MAFRFNDWLLLVLLVAGSTAQAADLIFITHNETGIESIRSQDLREIYLKKKRFWPNNVKVRPLDLPAGNPVRLKFLQQVLRKNETQMTEYWIQEKQSTGSVQPLQIPSSEMVIYLVEVMPGSIGYLEGTSEILSQLSSRNLKQLKYDPN